MVFPAEVAFRFVDEPAQMVDGVADTAVGTPGNAFTVTVVGVEVAEGEQVPLTTTS